MRPETIRIEPLSDDSYAVGDGAPVNILIGGGKKTPGGRIMIIMGESIADMTLEDTMILMKSVREIHQSRQKSATTRGSGS
jgi:hypothetical protein